MHINEVAAGIASDGPAVGLRAVVALLARLGVDGAAVRRRLDRAA